MQRPNFTKLGLKYDEQLTSHHTKFDSSPRLETKVTSLFLNFPIPGLEAALAEFFLLTGNEKRGRVGKKQYTPGEPIDRNVRISGNLVASKMSS